MATSTPAILADNLTGLDTYVSHGYTTHLHGPDVNLHHPDGCNARFSALKASDILDAEVMTERRLCPCLGAMKDVLGVYRDLPAAEQVHLIALDRNGLDERLFRHLRLASYVNLRPYREVDAGGFALTLATDRWAAALTATLVTKDTSTPLVVKRDAGTPLVCDLGVFDPPTLRTFDTVAGVCAETSFADLRHVGPAALSLAGV